MFDKVITAPKLYCLNYYHIFVTDKQMQDSYL